MINAGDYCINPRQVAVALTPVRTIGGNWEITLWTSGGVLKIPLATEEAANAVYAALSRHDG